MSIIKPMSLESENLVTNRIEQLKQLYPEIVTEGDGSVDFEKLRLIMGDEVNESDERYVFTWPGKRDAIRQSQTPSVATLRPSIHESCGRDGEDGSFNSDNLYIEGDNLEVLKLLQHSYHGKIKTVYIDPPYNTGHDFVYKDSFDDTIENYKQQAGISGQSNVDTSGRYHSDWCSMMYPRLKLARELLTKDGAIFISIDDNESSNLRKICEEVFGPQCFVGDIAWQRTYAPRNDSKGISTEVEHLLVFSKTPGWSPKKLPRTAEMNAKYGSIDGDEVLWRADNPCGPGAAAHQGMVYAIQHPFTGEYLYPSNDAHWRYQQDRMLEIMNGWGEYKLRDIDDAAQRAKVCGISEHEVRNDVKAIVLVQPIEKARAYAQEVYDAGKWPIYYFTKRGLGGIAKKTYLDEKNGKVATNLWLCSEVGHSDEAKKELKSLFEGRAPFDTPKPVRLIERILSISTDKNSLVLDFFSGSGSTAEAVMRKNVQDEGSRQFILVQIPEAASGEYLNLCEIGEDRIRRAGAKIIAEIEESNNHPKLGEDPMVIPDAGFRVFKLDESGINKQDLNAAAERGELLGGDSLLDSVVKPSHSDVDIVFEMMLKWGLELTLPIEKTELASCECYVVAGGELICCMSDGLTVEVLEAIAELEPRRVLMLDSILTDTLKLNAVQIFKRVGDRTGVEVELRTV